LQRRSRKRICMSELRFACLRMSARNRNGRDIVNFANQFPTAKNYLLVFSQFEQWFPGW
jgi:hypothetical protein